MTEEHYKVALLGGAQVGKKLFVVRLRFDRWVDEYNPESDGYSTKTMEVDAIMTTVEFCTATCSDENQNEVKKMAIQNCDGCMLAYSIDAKKSFELVQKEYENICKIKGLVDSTGQRLKKTPIVLVATKCDLNTTNRQVPTSLGEELGREYGIPYFETSAKENINITESTVALVKEMRKYRINNTEDNNKKKDRCVLM